MFSITLVTCGEVVSLFILILMADLSFSALHRFHSKGSTFLYGIKRLYNNKTKIHPYISILKTLVAYDFSMVLYF